MQISTVLPTVAKPLLQADERCRPRQRPQTRMQELSGDVGIAHHAQGVYVLSVLGTDRRCFGPRVGSVAGDCVGLADVTQITALSH
jgi:hypothetical protein